VKRIEKSRSAGGHLRLGLLLGLVAMFLLVPAAMASAATGTVKIEGTGAGTVIEEGSTGTPPINCVYESPGPATGTCTNTLESNEGANGLKLKAIPAAGSELTEWKVLKGTPLTNQCEATNPATEEDRCGAYSFATGAIEIKAVFTKQPDVHIIIEGSGSGKVVGGGGTPGEPPVDCEWNGETEEQTGVCETNSQEAGGFYGINVTNEPAPGSKFAGWTVVEGFAVGCEPLEEACGVIKFEESEQITIKAAFEALPTYPLTVTKTGSGTVTSAPAGINCGSACSHGFLEGEVVTLSGAPDTGSEPVVWETCPGTVNGSNQCVVTMSEAKSVEASFEIERFALEITPAGTGSGEVKCDTGGGPEACAPEYSYGTHVTLTQEAAPGSTFAGWSGACSGLSGCEVTMTAPKAVTVTFKEAASNEANIRVYSEPVSEVQSLETTCTELNLGVWEPGNEYNSEKECELTATSTAANSTLEAEDAEAGLKGSEAGHLANGGWYLQSPLQAKATDGHSHGSSTGFTSMGENPIDLLTFPEPISPDPVHFSVKQHIGAEEGLRKGTYEETVILTLSTTEP
jgi:hypothetical protein